MTTEQNEKATWERPELLRLDAADAQGFPGVGSDITGSRANQAS